MHQIESWRGYAIKIKVEGAIYNKGESSRDIAKTNPKLFYPEN